MEAISRLTTWFQWRQDTKVLLLGAPASGKTTLLYRWKLGEAVDVIPTHGFNVETIVCHRRRLDIWDVAGWEPIQMRALCYATPESIVFFVHDCDADEERTEESVRFMHYHMEWMIEKGVKNIWILFNKQDQFSAEKRIDIIDHLRWRFTKELSSYSEHDIEWRIMDQPGLSAKTGKQIDSVLDDVVKVLNSRTKRVSSSPKGLKSQPNESTTDPSCSEATSAGDYMSPNSQLQEKVENYARNFHMNEDSFWDMFLKGDLERWDHPTYLHAAYKILADALKRGDDIWEAAEDFMEHLQRLRQKDMFKECNTDNRTMAMFWLYHLNLAMNSFAEHMHLSFTPSFADFTQVLRHTPTLMNTQLWSMYYSEELLFNTESKVYWHLPDLKPLPPPAVIPAPQSTESRAPGEYDDSERLIRFAFAVVKKYLVSDTTRRGAIVRYALSALQSTTQRLRANHKSIPQYSETQAYFWIQLVHSAFVSINDIYFDKSDKAPITIRKLSYTGFQMLFELSPTAWKKHYSPKLWNSIEARVHFVNPDVAPLPNVIRPESAGLTHLYLANACERRLLNVTPELPSAEELAFYSTLVISSDETRDVLGSKRHTRLLQYLYTAFTSSLKLSKTSDQTFKHHYSKLVDDLGNDEMNSRTETGFWSLMVLKAASLVNEEDSSKSIASFEHFIRSYQHLAYEDLPFCYFSEELWNGEEAKKTFVQPDRRKLDLSVIQDSSSHVEEVEECSESAVETKDESKDWIVI